MSHVSHPKRPRYTRVYVRRMANAAELSVRVDTPGDGIVRYTFFDMRDGMQLHVLFRCAGGDVAAGFISGWVSGRNRELYK